MSDHARPLNERGRADAPRMAARLADAGCLPDRVLSSTARRAKETAELFVDAAGLGEPIEYRNQLYHAPPGDILDVIAEVGGDAGRLMVVAHNPGMEQLVRRLTGYEGGMPTAGIARIEVTLDAWEEVGEVSEGKLVEFYLPKDE